jgi:hypothetical protein
MNDPETLYRMKCCQCDKMLGWLNPFKESLDVMILCEKCVDAPWPLGQSEEKLETETSRLTAGQGTHPTALSQRPRFVDYNFAKGFPAMIERWRELCFLVANEQHSERLSELVRELTRELDAREEARYRAQRQSSLASLPSHPLDTARR